MAFQSLTAEIVRGTITRSTARANIQLAAADRIPQGAGSPLALQIAYPQEVIPVELRLVRQGAAGGGGDIRFDGPGGPTTKRFDQATSALIVLHGQAPTSGDQPDVELQVFVNEERRPGLRLAVNTTPVSLAIEDANGSDPASEFVLPNSPLRLRAVPTPAGPGNVRWFSFPPDVLRINGSAQQATVEVSLVPPAPLPARADRPLRLVALFEPASGPAAIAVQEFWPIYDASEPGPYAVGSDSYTEPSFTIPGGLEGWPLDVEVTVQGLVRYPAQSAGTRTPFATRRAAYPLVVLAHGRHGASEFVRDAAGARVLDGAGRPTPIVVGGARVEFLNHEGLAYLAEHLASYGFIAVSINLNGRFNPANGRGELVQPQGALVTCRPFLVNQVAIAHRGLTILHHIRLWDARNGSDPFYTGRINTDQIGLIGHSRGGEAVVAAQDINATTPPALQSSIRALISIAPTDNRNIRVALPYLAIIGSDDADVHDLSGQRIYDRAAAPKQMVWVTGAIHNYFSSNWHWQDEVPADPPVNRLQHQAIAGGYSALFLLQQLGGLAGAAPYFAGEQRLPALAGIAIHHAVQIAGGLPIDTFEDTPANRDRNTLGEAVTTASLAEFDEADLHHFRSVGGSCTESTSSWFQDTNAVLVRWSSVSARYVTTLGGRSATTFSTLAFRVGQDSAINPAGANQNFRVRLTDNAGQSAVLRVGDFTSIPPIRQKTVGGTTVRVSVLKTVRLPLASFAAANPQLNLGALATLSFEFSEIGAGKLAIDQIEFSQ